MFSKVQVDVLAIRLATEPPQLAAWRTSLDSLKIGGRLQMHIEAFGNIVVNLCAGIPPQ